MQIHFRVEFLIKEGQLDEFKKLVQEMCTLVKEQEPDTISYQFYLDVENTKCIVNETYKDSNAAFVHMNGIAIQTIFPNIFKISRITKFDVYGNPDKDLEKMLVDFNAQIYNQFAGFTR
ncbi:MAG TPA: antibiotic biosynthesis monooxygenase [Verrucomicrobiae bacterium]|nr:antibiotic biosynthesis monooxygenase [Verrucomicrobiae bacterium]